MFAKKEYWAVETVKKNGREGNKQNEPMRNCTYKKFKGEIWSDSGINCKCQKSGVIMSLLGEVYSK